MSGAFMLSSTVYTENSFGSFYKHPSNPFQMFFLVELLTLGLVEHMFSNIIRENVI